MRRTNRLVVATVALAMVGSGCFGSFNMTRKLYRWNGEMSQDRWAKEAVFLILVWAPIYGLAGVGDALIFNSIEFWTGKNPIEMSTSGKGRMSRIIRDDAQAVLTRRLGPQGQEWRVDQFKHGQPAEGVRIARQGEISVASSTTDGHILFTAQTLPDGSLIIMNGQGQQVALYSPEKAERVLASVRQ